MKNKKYIIIILFIILMLTINRVEAHNDVLDVDYDPCQSSVYVSSSDIGDGYLEK